MKYIMSFFSLLTIIVCNAQDKYDYVAYNKLTEVVGTDYTIASVEDRSKILTVKSKYLLFINTTNGSTNRVEFANDAYFERILQVKLDSLSLNLILVAGKMSDVDKKNGIDWNDPTQLVALSPDGKTKTQLTEQDYFIHNWSVNQHSGSLVVTGYIDSNKNFKYDKKDKNEIRIYDLKALTLKTKI